MTARNQSSMLPCMFLMVGNEGGHWPCGLSRGRLLYIKSSNEHFTARANTPIFPNLRLTANNHHNY